MLKLGTVLLAIAALTLIGPTSSFADCGACHGDKPACCAKPAAAPSADIVDTAVAAGQFSTLAAALSAADLVETLKGEGPFTVLAPTDAAFEKLPDGTLESLLKPENKEKLVAILTYHVLPGEALAKDVVKLSEAETVQGSKVKIRVKKGKVKVDNATVVATLRALGRKLPSEEIVRLGVRAALDTGVSITGAYDDACASFFGGVVLTDNRRMILFKREVLDAEVMIYVPSESQLTSGVNVGRCRLIAPFVEEAYKLAVNGAYDRAMTLNGLLYCAAFKYDTDVVMDALRCGASGCGLSGTGPAYIALFRDDRDGMDVLDGLWRARGATVIRTRVTNLGVEV